MKTIFAKTIMGILITLITLFIGGYIVTTLYALSVEPKERETRTDAIVVLTGGNHRVSTGLQLLADDLAPTLFISGVHMQVTIEDIKSNYQGSKPLPTCCIKLGHKALTTYGNADETRDWIRENKIESIRLVTSNYHMWRSLLVFKQAVPEVKIIPHPVEEKDYGITDKKFWSLTFSEYLKILFRITKISVSEKHLGAE